VAGCRVPGAPGQEIIMSQHAVSLIKGIRTQFFDSRKKISLSMLDRPKFANYFFFALGLFSFDITTFNRRLQAIVSMQLQPVSSCSEVMQSIPEIKGWSRKRVFNRNEVNASVILDLKS